MLLIFPPFVAQMLNARMHLSKTYRKTERTVNHQICIGMDASLLH